MVSPFALGSSKVGASLAEADEGSVSAEVYSLVAAMVGASVAAGSAGATVAAGSSAEPQATSTSKAENSAATTAIRTIGPEIFSLKDIPILFTILGGNFSQLKFWSWAIISLLGVRCEAEPTNSQRTTPSVSMMKVEGVA